MDTLENIWNNGQACKSVDLVTETLNRLSLQNDEEFMKKIQENLIMRTTPNRHGHASDDQLLATADPLNYILKRIESLKQKNIKGVSRGLHRLKNRIKEHKKLLKKHGYFVFFYYS